MHKYLFALLVVVMGSAQATPVADYEAYLGSRRFLERGGPKIQKGRSEELVKVGCLIFAQENWAEYCLQLAQNAQLEQAQGNEERPQNADQTRQ